MKRNLLFLSIFVVTIVAIVLLNHPGRSETYVEIESLTNRIGTGFVVLHEVIQQNERLGRYVSNVDSDFYQRNEGWLLRNMTVYCSNRLIDHIEQISAESGIYKYTGNPDGNQLTMDIEKFKKYLVSLNEICVSETEYDGERALQATLFIDPEHKIWKARE